MSEKTSLHRLKSWYGILFALVCAFSAEAVLVGGTTLADPVQGVGRIAIVFLSLYTIHRFALECLRAYRPNRKELCTLALIMVFGLILIWLGRIMSFGLATYLATTEWFESVSVFSIYYAIPFAVGALLLQAVLGLHYSFVYYVSFAVIAGVYFPEDPVLIPYVLATCFMAALSLSRFRSRSAYLKAGFNIAVIAFPFALGSVVMSDSLAVSDISMRLIGALISGALCSIIAAGITPVVESLGGYVTDMRLIEMATLDHPLLKELSIQAPGTWNHSMVMGMMVESAASDIGANSVLARVGAYFHDIGKMKKPMYFVENQAGENRHDKLSTSMSALIIRSHVKDGIELAKEHKLPQAIVDMIPQHHGTSLIEFFYNKAKKEAKESTEEDQEAPEVDKSLYTYPGPKPQTKEAGILMLADGIEAAARTLSDPSQDRIQGMVQKMINKVFSSGELNECDLTLRDLHIIAKNYTRILTSIYHQRVAYAEPAEKVNEKSQSATSGKKDGAKKEGAEEGKSKKSKAEQAKAEIKAVPDVVVDKEPAKAESKEANKEGKESDSSTESSEEGEEKEEKKEDLKRLGI